MRMVRVDANSTFQCQLEVRHDVLGHNFSPSWGTSGTRNIPLGNRLVFLAAKRPAFKLPVF